MAVERKATAAGTGCRGAELRPADSGVLGRRSHTWLRALDADAGTPARGRTAAHAACFSMALSHGLAQDGTPPEELAVTATVGFQAGEGITGVQLDVRGRVAGIDAAGFEGSRRDGGRDARSRRRSPGSRSRTARRSRAELPP